MQALVAPGFEEARRAAHASAAPLSVERSPVGAAEGRFLREDLCSLTPLPPRDASAMDGWAVCGEGPWRVLEQVLAGRQASRPLASGEAVTIATGAAMPDRASGVLRLEHGTVDGEGLLQGTVEPGQDVRRAGEEAVEGDVLVRAGTRLGPAHLGLASAGGHDAVVVSGRPRARLLVLGDELLRSGVARDGMVRDSLGVQIPGWLRRLGFDVVGVDWVPDTLDGHERALGESGDVDVVVTTGGTATGPVDLLRAAVGSTGGTLVIDTVAVRPGSPMVLARWPDARWLVGLPGNPQAAVAALLTLGAPVCDALQGRPLAVLETRRLAGRIAPRGDRTRLVASREARGQVTPAEHIGSGMLRGLAEADGFAVAAAGGARDGDQVGWLPLP